jgi:hypothetical protein
LSSGTEQETAEISNKTNTVNMKNKTQRVSIKHDFLRFPELPNSRKGAEKLPY